MSYFDISINDDITYILNGIGHNCKINNLPTTAIINNTSMERTNDDKRIITKDTLSRGDYIEYNNLYFIVLNEINDQRYSTYYKAIMRNCNYNIKLVLNGKLYLFYSVIESDKFSVDEGKYINTLADTITITLPETDITKQIVENDRVVKFNKAWEVKGIDYTRKGLIQLKLQVTAIDENMDDKEREIGNYNRLDNPNQEPILPFEEKTLPQTKDIISVESLSDISVAYGTDINTINLPETVNVTLDDSTSEKLSIVWNTTNYEKDIAGIYILTGTIELTEGITNTTDIQTNINVIVEEEVVVEEGFTITLTGDDKVGAMTEGNYVATVYEGGNIVDKDVVFTLNDKLASFVSINGNECTLIGNEDFRTGDTILRATLVEDETVFAEKSVYVAGF